MNEAQFTVLMAVYGRDDPELFHRAVASVFRNSLQPSRTVIVVDGPIAGDLARQIDALERDSRVSVLRRRENGGLAAALNHGLAHIDTEWTVRADADDFNEPERFKILAKYARAGIDVIGSAICEVDRSGRRIAVKQAPLSHMDIVRYARRRNPFNHMSVAFRTQLAKECGGYPNIYLREDYGLWAAMLMRGAITQNIPDQLVLATAGEGMYRRRGGWRYALGEIELQSHLLQCGLKGWPAACVDGVLRAAVFIVPARLRGFVYRRALRARPTEELIA